MTLWFLPEVIFYTTQCVSIPLALSLSPISSRFCASARLRGGIPNLTQSHQKCVQVGEIHPLIAYKRNNKSTASMLFILVSATLCSALSIELIKFYVQLHIETDDRPAAYGFPGRRRNKPQTKTMAYISFYLFADQQFPFFAILRNVCAMIIMDTRTRHIHHIHCASFYFKCAAAICYDGTANTTQSPKMNETGNISIRKCVTIRYKPLGVI